MKKFCESLRQHAKNMINFENKKMLALTRKQLEMHEVYICWVRFFKKLFRDVNYRKVRDHFCYTVKYRSATHSICNLKCAQWSSCSFS